MGFNGNGKRIMEQNIADWVQECINRGVNNRMLTFERNLTKEFEEYHTNAIMEMNATVDGVKSQLLEAETVIALQETTLGNRFDANLRNEETINTLKAEMKELKNVNVLLEGLTHDGGEA